MLQVDWREVCDADPVFYVLDAALKVALNGLKEA
jgi:hypothetical protein